MSIARIPGIHGSLVVAGALALVGAGCRTAPRPARPGEPGVAASPVKAEPAPALVLGVESRYACMRRGGALQCWGKGVVFPDGETVSPEGLLTMPVDGVADFAVGSDRICVVTGGRLRCWGHDTSHITPPLQRDGEHGPIEEVDAVTDVVAVRIHDTTVCALDRAATLTCWTYEEPPEGHAEEGEDEPTAWMERRDVAEDEIVAFDVGDYFACAVRAGGSLTCWGADPAHVRRADDALSQCYDEAACPEIDGDEEEGDEGCDSAFGEMECDAAYDEQLAEAWADAVVIEDVPEPVEVEAGSDFACARTKQGRVYCWGEGLRGQLGRRTILGSVTAAAVQGIDDAVALEAGVAHVCAVLADGRVACWGDDRWGTVGGSTSAASSPRIIEGVDDAVDVVLAEDLSCALLRDGSARCWGRDSNARVRGGAPPPSQIPAVPVRDVVRLLPFGQDTCAGQGDGAMLCWGRHELDANQAVVALAEPRPRPHAGFVQLLSLAGPCGRTSTDELRCWRSAAEMHGGGPTALVATSVVAVDASKDRACLATRSGEVRCWTSASGKAPVPTPVTSVSAAIDVTVGPRHGCAVRRDGAVDCWKHDATTSTAPQRLPALTDAVAIVEATDRLCVRTKAGRVRCWDWDALDRPSFDHALEGVQALAAGLHHFCALAGGQAWCWGNNGSGQLGSAAFGRSAAGPQRVPGVSDLVELAAGDEHTCARDREGRVRCWGRGSEGQLGRVPDGQWVEPTPMLAPEWLEAGAATSRPR